MVYDLLDINRVVLTKIEKVDKEGKYSFFQRATNKSNEKD